MLQTPVLLIIFNRPDLTQQVFDAIKAVKPKQLFVSADGSREEIAGETSKCKKVRNIINQVDWDCNVKTLFHKKNLGCKIGVSSAVNWFFNHVDEGIILEDDCLPDKSFFSFCQELLHHYRHNNKILHIGGNNFQFGQKHGDGTYFFSTYGYIWGWASWKRAWKLYDINCKGLTEFKEKKMIENITQNKEIQQYWLNIFDKVHQGEIDSWAYQWVFAIWRNMGLTIVPNVNLVSNIGFGHKDAVHTTAYENVFANLKTGRLSSIIHPLEIKRDKAADEFVLELVYKEHNSKPSIFKRVIGKLKSINRILSKKLFKPKY